jgi:hypothetical protein
MFSLFLVFCSMAFLGLFYPRVAASACLVWTFGRIGYTVGYSSGNPEGVSQVSPFRPSSAVADQNKITPEQRIGFVYRIGGMASIGECSSLPVELVAFC